MVDDTAGQVEAQQRAPDDGTPSGAPPTPEHHAMSMTAAAGARPATARGAAAAADQAALNRLAQSEEQFGLFVASVQDYAIFMLDPAGHVISWNAGAERIKGYTAAEIIGQHFARFYPPEDLAWDKPGQALAEAARTGRVEDEGWRLRQDGTRFWANVVITALYDQSGQLRGFGKVTRDMTERRRAEEALKQTTADLEQRVAERTAALRAANQRLREAVRQREDFLAIASHELRTPLSTTKAYVQLLARALGGAGLSAGRPGEYMARLQQELARLEELVVDLLDATRLQQGRLELNRQPCNLTELAQQVLERFAHAAEHTPQHRLVLDAPAPVVGSWDRSRLDQVLSNLISNALKYSPAGGEVQVAVRLQAGQAAVTVADEGIGISDAEQAHLFTPFVRGESTSRGISGVGLGLYITKQIVERHGGTVTVQSWVGVGSTFTVCLPLAAPEQPRRPAR
jgi:PAS domain S-box-containing protein